MTLPAGEQWKENNAAARHWETLAFETAKGYYVAVAFLVGAAGAAIAWTSVPQALQRGAVAILPRGRTCALRACTQGPSEPEEVPQWLLRQTSRTGD